MTDDFLIRLENALHARRASHPGDPHNRIAMHPQTWYAVVRQVRNHPMTFTDGPVPKPELFGMEVVEDASVAPCTWRLERR